MSKAAILGWVLWSVGTVVWVYGYFVTGHPSLIDWQADAPWWIADFLPNVEAEVGMTVSFVSMIPMYWPTRSQAPSVRPQS
jgi:hypothetical protein